MRRHLWVLASAVACLLVVTAVASAQPASRFATFFVDRTLRVDYFHTGGGGREVFSLDRIVSDGPWPGSRTRLLDDRSLGTYFFEVIDPSTNQAIYSRGFSSMYAEWETTGEAHTDTHRTFHESLRFPWPKGAVQVVVKKRGAANLFHEVWSTLVDPASRFVNFEKKSAEFQRRRAELRAKQAPESEMDKLFTEELEWDTAFLASTKFSGKVGAFEGASYEATGLYRPGADCIMFTRDRVGFCRVCRRAIERTIDLYSKR